MAGFAPNVWPAALQVLLAVIALCPANAMAHDDDDRRTTAPTPTVTEAPIYLPYYDERSWSLVRGSIISTVCAPNHCNLLRRKLSVACD
jgi:hypothetical protein